MDRYNSSGISKDEWVMSNPTVIDYHHQPVFSKPSQPVTSSWQTKEDNRSLTQPGQTPAKVSTSGMWQPAASTQDTAPFKQLYNPFVEDDMEISDDEKHSKNTQKLSVSSGVKKPDIFATKPSTRRTLEVTSGAAFYKGLILYIPPFKQVSNTYRGPPAMKMLYASFEFSFKMPIKIEIKQKENDPNLMNASVIFQDNVIVKSTSWAQAAQNDVSVKALELLSETCYTIQAKEDYFLKCKMIDGSDMKTLNLKKWEAVSQKHPNLLEITKDSHIQKTFAVFLDSHTSTGLFEEIVCCNLRRQDVNSIKGVVEFFQLTMLPCCLTINQFKKDTKTPCVVSIQKYTSAKKLLEILIESGGENDKFRLHPPDTFKDFYQLHQSFWDPALQKPGNKHNVLKSKTTLEDDELQSIILKPYENIVSELFEKHKLLPKVEKQNENVKIRKAGDEFMKDTFKIDMAHSKNVAPVERMQLLLKYMEQLQEYGSRVLTSGRSEMIKIYHNAIDNLRKDLDTCRKDIEKEQQNKTTEKEVRKTETHRSHVSRSPTRRSTPPKGHSKSPGRQRPGSPRRPEKRISASPRRKPRSRSPRRPVRTTRDSPPRRARSPAKRTSPDRRARSPRPYTTQITQYQNDQNFAAIFKDKFRKFVEILRRFRIEIENTPIERRGGLTEKMFKCQEQLLKFHKEAMANEQNLSCYLDEMVICREELDEQIQLIAGKPGPNDLPRKLNPPPPWANVRHFETTTPYSSYPTPVPPPPTFGNKILPPPQVFTPQVFTPQVFTPQVTKPPEYSLPFYNR